VGEAVLMDKENSIDGATHPEGGVLVTHPLEPSWDRLVLLKQRVLGAKGVVGQGGQGDRTVQCQGVAGVHFGCEGFH